MGKPEISLIIPAFNEERYLGQTLSSVREAQKYYGNPGLIEVVVVDNCSTDGTEKIARNFGARVVREKKRCIASVRNRGAAAAEGKILGFLDADSTLTPHMFCSIHDVMSCDAYIGGGTMIKFERSSPGLFCTRCLTVFPARWLFGVMGGLLFTEKKTFEELGGFDESFYCAEDTDFAIKLKKYGKRKGKKFKVITRDYVITSARTFDRFGDWHYFKNIPGILFRGGIRAFKNKDFCARYWYDIKR